MPAEDRPPPRTGARRRDRALPSLVVIVALVAATLGIGWGLQRRAERLVDHEDVAFSALERVRDAQTVYRERAGRYGWMDELARAGLLRGEHLVDDGDRTHLEIAGFRVDVLLPTARLGPGRIAVGLRDRAGPEPDAGLVRRHFALIARPLVPGEDGFRSWYLDEQGHVFVHEGVLDAEAGDDLLPAFLLGRAGRVSDRAPWQPIGALEED